MHAPLIAAAVMLAAPAAWAGQVTLGASVGTSYDLISTGDGMLSGNSPGFWTTNFFDSDIGTVPPVDAHFGPTTFATGPQTLGVFPIISGGAESLTLGFIDGDSATGLAQITDIVDGSPNPHISFTWDYTATGDPAWLASFPGGMATGDYTFDTVPTLLDEFVLRPGDEFLSGSAGQINDTTPMPEPATLALLGTALIGLGIGLMRRRPLL